MQYDACRTAFFFSGKVLTACPFTGCRPMRRLAPALRIRLLPRESGYPWALTRRAKKRRFSAGRETKRNRLPLLPASSQHCFPMPDLPGRSAPACQPQQTGSAAGTSKTANTSGRNQQKPTGILWDRRRLSGPVHSAGADLPAPAQGTIESGHIPVGRMGRTMLRFLNTAPVCL